MNADHWCCLCPRKAVFVHDIGALCPHCNREVTDLAVWLYQVMQWRPMSKDERRHYYDNSSKH